MSKKPEVGRPEDGKPVIGRPVKVPREAILAEALGLLDTDGIDFSVRKLAKNLGTGTSSIYNHFGNREGLLEAMANEVLKKVWPHCDESLAWDESLRQWANKVRNNFKNRKAAMSLAANALVSEDSIELIRNLSRVICKSGVSQDSAVVQAQGLIWMVVGSVTLESNELRMRKKAKGSEQFRIASESAFSDQLTIFGDAKSYDTFWDTIVERNIEGIRSLGKAGA